MLKVRIIPCLDVKDGRVVILRDNKKFSIADQSYSYVCEASMRIFEPVAHRILWMTLKKYPHLVPPKLVRKIKSDLVSHGVNRRYGISEGEVYYIYHNADIGIGKPLSQNSAWEEVHIAFVRDFILRERGRIGATFVDVGANIGTHTVFAICNGFDKAICVEPDTENFKLLRLNQIINNIETKCYNFNLAVSDSSGSLVFQKSPINYGDHRVKLRDSRENHLGECNWEVTEVQANTLSEIIRLSGVNDADIGLVWIDVQGHETQTLAGAPTLLASDTPIVFEFWPYGLQRSGGIDRLLDLVKHKRMFDIRRGHETNFQLVSPEILKQIYDEKTQNIASSVDYHSDILLM